MPTVEELFARSFVINLDTATDRMALLAKSFGRAGLPVPRRFGACHLRKLEYNPWWRRIPGGRHHAANVSASHLQCIHAAQALGWPFVFVFEDDAWPCRDALDVLGREFRAARPTGLWFPGWYDRRDPGSDVVWFAGAHAYVVFADTYAALCDAYRADQPNWHADTVPFRYSPLRPAVRASDRCVFTQMNIVDGAPAYARLFREEGGERVPGCWSAFRRAVPEGFPSYEEVVGG